MLSDLARDVALKVLDLLPANDRVKLAMQSSEWRVLAMAPISSMTISVNADSSEGMELWMTDRGRDSLVASALQTLHLHSEGESYPFINSRDYELAYDQGGYESDDEFRGDGLLIEPGDFTSACSVSAIDLNLSHLSSSIFELKVRMVDASDEHYTIGQSGDNALVAPIGTIFMTFYTLLDHLFHHTMCVCSTFPSLLCMYCL